MVFVSSNRPLYQRVEKNGIIYLYQANDKQKIRVILFATQNQLKTLRFPLEILLNKRLEIMQILIWMLLTNQIVKIYVLYLMEIIGCKKNSKDSFKQGIIETIDGDSLGFHEGLANYTIGQRKGIGVGGIKGQHEQKPLYVVDLNLQNNKVIVGQKTN